MRFAPYDTTRTVANIVVDGSPNESTVLCLTHWPGIPQPAGLGDDLSAQMAFRYLGDPPAHPPADLVTNNHFDQDGLVSVFALVEPESALEHRDLLIDLAAAGDFGTYRDRRAARASMAISRIAEQPFDDYGDFTGSAYERALLLVLPLLLDGDRFRDDWGDEDDELDASERAIAAGEVAITESRTVDLAVVEVPERLDALGGHRFGGERFEVLHPMAVNNATSCLRLLVVKGRRYRYTDRYETWVQLRSRTPRPRVDLRPLADQLTAAETGTVTWSADAPSALTPSLTHTGESSLDRAAVVARLERHLATAPPAWDPYA